MMPGARRLLATLAAFSAVVVWLGYLGFDVDDDTGTPFDAILENGVQMTPNLSDDGTHQAIVDRPLFLPDRRPWRPVPKPPPPVDPAPELPSLVHLPADLLGVVVSPSGNTAILRFEGEASAVVREGATIKGWTLKRVSAREVLLASSDQERTVTFAPHHAFIAPNVEVVQSLSPPVRRRR